ncbi:hypothetical protein VNO77_33999 [Canavalia gladiata]|uniref:Uncharacterized protein n=1 Tax=Canavalia gladiata TaxID=3824 RepID=A0AAN9PYW4_CANGL
MLSHECLDLYYLSKLYNDQVWRLFYQSWSAAGDRNLANVHAIGTGFAFVKSRLWLALCFSLNSRWGFTHGSNRMGSGPSLKGQHFWYYDGHKDDFDGG